MEESGQYWEISASESVVAVPPAVVESMRQAAMMGLQKIPRRGLEIGGVLFGQRVDGRVVVHQWREVFCEHANGPGFDLSASDEDGLTRLLEDSRDDPDLGSLEIVGWFRTRTRGEARLEEPDVRLHSQFFPGRDQFVLVIRPFLYEPAKACLYVVGVDGQFCVSPLVEFESKKGRAARAGFDPALRPRRPVETDPLPWSAARSARKAAEGSTTDERRPVPEIPSAPAPLPVPYPNRAMQVRKVVSSLSPARVALMVVVAVAGIVLLAPAFDEGETVGVSLRVEELSGQLLLRWNPRSERVQLANAGTLRIQETREEGNAVHRVHLASEELRSGNLVYERAGGDTEFHLTLHEPGREPATEIARFVGGPAPAPPAMGSEQEALLERLRSEADLARRDLVAEERRGEALRAAIEAARRRITER